MAHDGWFSFGEVEIVNSERTVAYAKALVPQLGIRNCASCKGLRYVVNRPEYTGTGTRYGEDIEEQTQYRTPFLDHPDWFDPDNPDTWDFAGFYPLSVEGIDDSTRQASVVESSVNGGVVLRPRLGTQEMRFTGLLIARTEAGLESGRVWLSRSLDAGRCGGDEDCEGTVLSFFSACPECLPLEGYNYFADDGGSAHGNGDWKVVGGSGIWTPTSPSDPQGSTYTPATVNGTEYLEHSVFGAVCDDMKFTVDFTGSATVPVAQRTNAVPNPAFRSIGGTSLVRKNIAINSAARETLYGWFDDPSATSSLSRVSDTGLAALVGADVNTWGRQSMSSFMGTPLYFGAGNGVTLSANSGVQKMYVEESTPIVASAYVRADVPGSSFRVSITFYNASNAVISTFNGAYVAYSGTAIRPFASTSTPAGARWVTVKVNTDATTNMRWVDYTCWLIEHARVLLPYFDGSVAAPNGWVNYYDPEATLAGGNERPSIMGGSAPLKSLTAYDYPTTASPDLAVEIPETGGARTSAGTYRILTLTTRADDTVATTNSADIAAVPGQWWSGLIRLGRPAGTGTATVKVQMVAYTSSNVSLGVIADSGNLNFTTSAVVDAVAPATVITPATTARVALRILAVGTLPGDTEFEVEHILAEQVSGVGVSAGAYFDGFTSDAGGVDYFWQGQTDLSSSIAGVAPAASTLVRLEARDEDGALLGSTTSETYAGSISLTVDGTAHERIAFRLVPLEAGVIEIGDVTWNWAQPIGYDEESSYYLYPVGRYAPVEAVPGLGPDATAQMVDDFARKYRRTMREVTCTSGPTVIEKFSSNSAALVKVEFTLVAGVPHQYGEEKFLGSIALSSAVYATDIHDPNAFLITPPMPVCTPDVDLGPVVDPTCATIPVPPSVPSIMSVCNPSTGPVYNRFGFYIDETLVPEWETLVPVLRVTGGEEISRLTVRFFPTPIPLTPPEDIDPCSDNTDVSINYVPTDGIVVNGITERIYSEHTNAISGRVSKRPAAHLVTAIDFSPFEWPIISCGTGFLVVVETYEPLDTSELHLSVAARA